VSKRKNSNHPRSDDASTEDTVCVAVEDAQHIAEMALRKAGAPNDHACLQSQLLIDAELSGAASHGLLRLERIIERGRNGVVDLDADGTHTWISDAFLKVDGNRGLGPVVLDRALQAAMGRADTTGISAIGISNSNHIGKLGWYADRVAREGFILILISTSEALVHPWGGSRALLGTNPIAIGIPTADGPFVIDLATSLVSMGKIHDFANHNRPLEAGWAVDSKGAPTTDAEAAKRGAIAPFGEGKGYALGLAFELMIAALTDAALGREVKGTLDATEVCNKGDLAIVIKPGSGATASRLSEYLEEIRTSPPAQGFDKVMVPGDRAATCRENAKANGISMPSWIWSRLCELAGQDMQRNLSK
jgi:L-2-hydroxycarboxylate dehydrogenase (NAD+)